MLSKQRQGREREKKMKKGLEALSGGENIRFENMMLTEGHACYSHDCCARNNRKRIQKDERGEIRDMQRRDIFLWRSNQAS